MEASSTTEPFRFSATAYPPQGSGAGSSDQPAERPHADALVLETKREIRRLVQEIAALSHSRIPARQFWPRFLSDVGTAMAAEGAILWQLCEGRWISSVHHGHVDRRLLVPHGNTQGHTPGPAEADCHTLMIREVAHGGGPVIVPPSGAWDAADAKSADESRKSRVSESGTPQVPTEPANPTAFLAAVVPIPVDPDQPVEWMMELLLPLGGGPATQRGYLRFAAQMADLAADYLRRERLRTARSQADEAARMHESLLALYRSEDLTTAESRIVDAAARLFSAERVSLVRRRRVRRRRDRHRRNLWSVVAVSGVEQIDPALPAVHAIRQIAAESNNPVGFVSAEPRDNSPAEDSGGAACEGMLMLRGVASIDAASDARLVVEDRVAGDREAEEVDAEQRQRWSLFLQHAECVLARCQQRSGLGGWIDASGDRLRIRMRPPLFAATVAVAVLALGAIPVPLMVTADARLEPRQVQILYAPRDAVIDAIWVDHGDAVEPGDAVLRLVDAELDRSISSLLGRRAVLTERLAELRVRLVSRTANDADEAERLQTEQRVANEELRSIAAELSVLEEERERLVLRSDRSGIVDAWQIQERLESRPVRRGQVLFRIVAPEEGWFVEADVPQNRLDHLLASHADAPLQGTAVLAAFPDQAIPAKLEAIGPAAWPLVAGASPPSLASAASSPELAGTVTFAVDAEQLPLKQPGAPLKIAIDCGLRPLAYVACQDLVRTVVGWLRLYC